MLTHVVAGDVGERGVEVRFGSSGGDLTL